MIVMDMMRNKIIVFIICSFLISQNSLALTLVQSYSESNYGNDYSVFTGNLNATSQSFTGNGGVLNSVKFYLYKAGSPTGNATVKIYAHTGTYGTSSVPTGSVLATSDNFDVSTLTGSITLITFNFTGANKITLTNGTYYTATYNWSGGDASNKTVFGADATSPTGGGNFAFNDGSWTAFSGSDAIYYIYSDDLTSGSTASASSTADIQVMPFNLFMGFILFFISFFFIIYVHNVLMRKKNY